jgi:T5SS/PEP-CTERM-associated repeat protein
MIVSSVRSKWQPAFLTRTRVSLLTLALVTLFGSPAHAAISTTGNVTPDPRTTTSSDTLYIGRTADGTMTVDDGSDVISDRSYLGYDAAASGVATISGVGSTWSNDWFYIGRWGRGELTIEGGATVNTDGFASIADIESSSGEVTVTGTNSKWNITSSLDVGNEGNGSLTVTNGGQISSSSGHVGSDGTGSATISGSGSSWTTTQTLTTNYGSLTISDGGLASSGRAGIGVFPLAVGTATIDGAASKWINTGELSVGFEGTGTLHINGGLAEVAQDTILGRSATGNGSIHLDHGTLTTASLLARFSDLKGTGTINAHGLVTDIDLVFDENNGLQRQIVVDDELDQNVTINLDASAAGSLGAGFRGQGSLTIAGGASVSSRDGYLGYHATASGTASVDGPGSSWMLSGDLYVGFNGTGVLQIGSGGRVSVGDTISISSSSRLNLEGGSLVASTIAFPTAGGQFDWISGTLHVGRYNGSLTNAAGLLAPGQSAGSTTIAGSYIQQAAAALQIEIGGTMPTSQHDFVDVLGAVTLGGQLQLSLIDGFVPGPENIFTVLSASGNIMGEFGNIPSGQRLTTTDGLYSFLVHYGVGSAFDLRQVVLTNFQSTILPGDFNHNGSVDAVDYVVWRRNLSGNTFVDETNYQTWRTNFGRTAEQMAESTSVPEPAAIALMCTLLAAASFARRARPT